MRKTRYVKDNTVADRGATHNAIFGRKDVLKGGLADKSKVKDFDKTQLKKGIKVEMELHTTNKTIAKELAMDNLTKLPDYYDRLEKIEKAPSKHPFELRNDSDLWDNPIEMLLPAQIGYTTKQITKLSDREQTETIQKYISENPGSEEWDTIIISRYSNRASLEEIPKGERELYRTSEDFVSNSIAERDDYVVSDKIELDDQYEVISYDDGLYLVAERPIKHEAISNSQLYVINEHAQESKIWRENPKGIEFQMAEANRNEFIDGDAILDEDRQDARVISEVLVHSLPKKNVDFDVQVSGNNFSAVGGDSEGEGQVSVAGHTSDNIRNVDVEYNPKTIAIDLTEEDGEKTTIIVNEFKVEDDE